MGEIVGCDDCGMEFELASAGWDGTKHTCPDCGSTNLHEVETEDEDG